LALPPCYALSKNSAARQLTDILQYGLHPQMSLRPLIYMVTTHPKNPEKSGNLTLVGETSEKLGIVREIVVCLWHADCCCSCCSHKKSKSKVDDLYCGFCSSTESLQNRSTILLLFIGPYAAATLRRFSIEGPRKVPSCTAW